jgi:hypothetical protein
VTKQRIESKNISNALLLYGSFRISDIREKTIYKAIITNSVTRPSSEPTKTPLENSVADVRLSTEHK